MKEWIYTSTFPSGHSWPVIGRTLRFLPFTIINASRSLCKVPIILFRFFLSNLTFPRQIFRKCSDIIFYENPSREGRVVPCGQTDRHDDAKSRFSQFWLTRAKVGCSLAFLYLYLCINSRLLNQFLLQCAVSVFCPKKLECQFNDSSPCTADVKNKWSYFFVPPLALLAWGNIYIWLR